MVGIAAGDGMTGQHRQHWMQRALTLAQQAQDLGEVPVGACIIQAGQCIGEGFNQPIQQHDPSAHAEIIALRQAAQTVQNYRLPGATLVVTLEPCMMCVGALLHARIARVIYAADDAKVGVFSRGLLQSVAGRFNHQIEVVPGVMAAEAQALLQRFFQQRR